MNDTVKLIIEIPKETLNEIKDNVMFAGTIPSEILWDVNSAIVNGTPLDDVKAEIGDLRNQNLFGIISNYELLDVVLEIIDKYIGKAEKGGE